MSNFVPETPTDLTRRIEGVRCYVSSVNEDQTKATDFVAAWIASHRHEIGGTDLRFIRQAWFGKVN